MYSFIICSSLLDILVWHGYYGLGSKRQIIRQRVVAWRFYYVCRPSSRFFTSEFPLV